MRIFARFILIISALAAAELMVMALLSALGLPEGTPRDVLAPLMLSAIVSPFAYKFIKTMDDLQRTNRTLRMLSACNQALLRAKDEYGLLRDVCKDIVEVGGYRMAWVGFAQQDADRTITPAAYAGMGPGYLKSVLSVLAEDDGENPAGAAVRTGRTHVRGIRRDSGGAGWMAEAAARGYRTAISLPLEAAGGTIGALNIFSAGKGFDEREKALMRELSGDLAYGIVALRGEKECAAGAGRARAGEAWRPRHGLRILNAHFS